VTTKGPAGAGEVRAGLVVAADGRGSELRRLAGLRPRAFGVQFDVLWFRLPRSDAVRYTLGRIGARQMLVTLDRGDYFQCGSIIRKGDYEGIRAEGLEAFRERIATVAPGLRAATAALTDWDQIKLLTVQVDRLEEAWHRPGLLCIGDAAHAMSPAGGVGVNYAIADAVATANLLAEKLRTGSPRDDDLDLVRRRRLPPVRLMQRLQVMQARMPGRVAEGATFERPISIMSKLPPVRRLAGRIVGIGFRREHVRSPAAAGGS
jgi:2-polyprenyl-6-methoxyphenol hydroxylase-like FAD-dependent oxidoreductase